jgi:hypothetical protein
MAMKAPENFLFGCDPEFFLYDTNTGEPISAVGLVPGTKAEPYKVDKGAVQLDGMAAEFNIDPVNNFEEFNDNIKIVMAQLKKMLPTNIGFLIQPSVHFSQEIMDNATDSAKTLGCDPDYNAWTGERNEIPDTSHCPNLRTASGHIHIGWTDGMPPMDPEHFNLCRDLAKQMDWYLGAWSLRHDKSVERRKLYGKAGAFRPKPYGCEYRVLSNFWLTSKDRRQQVWDRAVMAIKDMNGWFLPEHGRDYRNDYLLQYINTGDKAWAEYLPQYPQRTLNDDYRPKMKAA